jgi:hypothetical protein
MSDSLDALRYLAPYRNSFWRWGDDGDVAEWQTGGTIAFSKQIQDVLAALPDRQLPPFELILLVLAACRDTWYEDIGDLAGAGSLFRLQTDPSMREQWKNLLASLDAVHSLPPKARQSIECVVTVVDMIPRQYEIATGTAGDIADVLSQPRWLQDALLPGSLAVTSEVRTARFGRFAHRLASVTTEQLLNRMSTGLDDLPVSASDSSELQEELQASPQRSVQQLIEELRNDDELGPLVRLVRMLSAVLTLPRNPSEPDEMPQGGVSDISNRGTLDQLLLSELANDDETLMTRIALNEALYIRRETPPSHPVNQRVMLIDSGIRMWGMPRLCAVAVALSLATQDNQGTAARVFRSSARGLKHADLTTREGLKGHLAALDHLAHPGDVLEAWLKESQAEETDRILITGEDVWADADFRQCLAQHEVRQCFVVTVNRAGRVRLIRRSLTGEKLLREIQLDLDEISSVKKDSTESLIDPNVDSNLPAILRLRRLPLRLPCAYGDSADLAVFPGDAGEKPDLVQLTKDRRLLLWDAPQKGGRQLSDRMPPGNIQWSGQLQDDGSLSLVIGYLRCQSLHHVCIDANRRDVKIQKLQIDADRFGRKMANAVCGHLGAIIVICPGAVLAVDPMTGEQLDDQPVELPYHWVRDRLFVAYGSAQLLSFAGGQLQFETLTNPDQISSGVQMLGVVGHPDHPQILLSNGRIHDVNHRTQRSVLDTAISSSYTLNCVSSDGLRFVLTAHEKPYDDSGYTYTYSTHDYESRDNRKMIGHWLFELPVDYGQSEQFEVSVTKVHGHQRPQATIFRGSQAYPTDRSLFRRPSLLGCGRYLMIITKKGRRLTFDVCDGHPEDIVLRDFRDEDGVCQTTENFEVIPSPPGTGYTLRQVSWSDGSRAVLDSRGMLHLQSSDNSIPEFTLILDQTRVSGWSAGNHLWGLDYYTHDPLDNHRELDAQQVMSLIDSFLKRLP